nr:hypothetical protein [Tanacetum cinerariifolium]
MPPEHHIPLWPILECYRLVSRAKVIENQAPGSLKYVPDLIKLKDHVPWHIPEYPKDLVPTEDEAPIEAYILEDASKPTPPLPPSFLSPRIRPLHTRAAMAQMRATIPSTYHLLLPSGTPPLLPIPLPVPSTSRRAEIPKADTPPRKRLLLTAPRLGCKVGENNLYKLLLTRVMDAPTLPVSAEKNLEDPIEIRVDIVHPAPADVFPAATVNGYGRGRECFTNFMLTFLSMFFSDNLYKLLLTRVMDAPTLPVSAKKNLEDPIEIRVDIVHHAPADVFPAATV